MPSFFLIIRRPPLSALFPYATLFRSLHQSISIGSSSKYSASGGANSDEDPMEIRSEEHTSELQSRVDISYAVFFFNHTATTAICPLSLRDALPISSSINLHRIFVEVFGVGRRKLRRRSYGD